MTIDTWLAISAGATLLLAIAAFWAIWQNYQFKNKERRERLLNEVIKWLKELENRVFPFPSGIMSKESLEEIEYKEKAGLSLESWKSLMDLDSFLTRINNLENATNEGEYIQKIASGVNSNLGNSIEVVLDHLRERRKIIMARPQNPHTAHDMNEKEYALIFELMQDDTKPLEGLTLSESGLHSVLLSRNAGAIRKSITNAVDKVVEIKTRDIG